MRNPIKKLISFAVTATFVIQNTAYPLSPPSLFNPIPADQSYRVKDLALAKASLLSHISPRATDPTGENRFLDTPYPVRERVSDQTTLLYDFPRVQEVLRKGEKAGILLPVTIEHQKAQYNGNIAPRQTTYYAYISGEQGTMPGQVKKDAGLHITVYTEEEKSKAEAAGVEFRHGARIFRDQSEIDAFVEHELWTDHILAQITDDGRTAFGENDISVQRVKNFLSAIGAIGLADDFLGSVRSGRVFSIDREAVVTTVDGERIKVKDKRVNVDHASNIGINVKTRPPDMTEDLELALIHEVFSRAGITRALNDSPGTTSLVRRIYQLFLANETAYLQNNESAANDIGQLLTGNTAGLGSLSFEPDLNAKMGRDFANPISLGSKDIQRRRLDSAILKIRTWKARNPKEEWEAPATPGSSTSKLQKVVHDAYKEYNLTDLAISDVIELVSNSFDADTYPYVMGNIEHVLDEAGIDRSKNVNGVALTPAAFHNIAGELARIASSDITFSEAKNLYFVFNELLFNIEAGEKRIAELLWIEDEIARELEAPGTRKLPMIAAMQDLHGAARRAMALVGFTLGLSADAYGHIETLDDLKRLLPNIGDENIRFVGMDDKYDRGEDPVGVFELVRWLGDEGKLQHITGNHDLWRMMGVLGVHRYFDESEPGVDYMSTENKQHHPAFWAKDAWEHAGWGTTEIDQENEERANKEIRYVNSAITTRNRSAQAIGGAQIPLLDEMLLRPVRERYTKDLKTLKIYNGAVREQLDIEESLVEKLLALDILTPENREIILGNRSRTATEKVFIDLPDSLAVTIDALRKTIAKRNDVITRLNQEHGLAASLISIREVNYGNYHRQPGIIERTLWDMKHFRLFYVDIYGYLHLHSVIPFDKETGEIRVNFNGHTGLKALEVMQSRVRDFAAGMKTIPDDYAWRKKMWKELGPVLTTVNHWYSDTTKIAKPEKVQEFVEAGSINMFKPGEVFGRTSEVSAFTTRGASLGVIFGHNERKKFDAREGAATPLPWMIPFPETETAQMLIDWQMSEGYMEQGGILTVFKRDKNGDMTGLRAWGYKEPKSEEIGDITFDNLGILSIEQINFLTSLSSREDFTEQNRRLLADLADEKRDGFTEQEGAFIRALADNEETYASLTDEKQKARIKAFMRRLADGKNFGLSAEQKKMIHDMADGEFYMRWFQIKALKNAYQKINNVIEEAGQHGKDKKVEHYIDLRDKVADKLERSGVLVRPRIDKALMAIAETFGEGALTEAAFREARLARMDRREEYSRVITGRDSEETLRNIDLEFHRLRNLSLVTPEIRHQLQPEQELTDIFLLSRVISGLSIDQIGYIVRKVPELHLDTYSFEDAVNPSNLLSKIEMAKNELLWFEELTSNLARGAEESRTVYHLIPLSIIPHEMRGITQKLANAERDPEIKEKIKLLDDEEYADYARIASDLAARGNLVNIALVNPSDADIDKLRGIDGVKASGFSVPDGIGNYQQLEGIIAVLRALQLSDRERLAMLYGFLAGERMPDDMKNALDSADLNDPAALIAQKIIFNLPRVELEDLNQLRGINRLLREALVRA